jgi:hypothetical protein
MTMELFRLDGGTATFEELGQTNGIRFWYARDLMTLLGYEIFDTFEKNCINRPRTKSL